MEKLARAKGLVEELVGWKINSYDANGRPEDFAAYDLIGNGSVVGVRDLMMRHQLKASEVMLVAIGHIETLSGTE